MSDNTKDLSASSHSINSDEGYVYISMTDPIHKGIWTDPAEFVWAIGEYGRKILLAGFLSHEFSPEQIATAFRQGKYHAELSVQHDQMFVCNNHDIVNAHNYMTKNENVKFQQCFNEKNRKEWEDVPEQRMEVVKWIHELKKALDTLLELLAEAVRDINDGMHLSELLADCIWLSPKEGEIKLTCGDPELDRQIIPINLFLLFVAAAVVVLTAYAVETFVFGH